MEGAQGVVSFFISGRGGGLLHHLKVNHPRLLLPKPAAGVLVAHRHAVADEVVELLIVLEQGAGGLMPRHLPHRILQRRRWQVRIQPHQRRPQVPRQHHLPPVHPSQRAVRAKCLLIPRIHAFPSQHGFQMAINFGCTFIIDSTTIRVPNASIVCVLIMTMATIRLSRYRTRSLDRAIALVIAANLICYVVRTMLWFYLDQYEGYMRDTAFSDYMTMFYFTSGIAMFATALLMLLTIITDIIERNKIEAGMDSLTGVLNRRGFDNVVAEAHKSGNSFGAIIAIDLDKFKSINDRFGHAGGDQVLVQVAAILRSHCEQFGSAVRMGGEEFLILVKQTHSVAAETLAETLRVAIGGLRLPGFPAEFRITASIGVAHIASEEHIEDACRNADVALYVAKGSGRNCVVCSEDSRIINAKSGIASE